LKEAVFKNQFKLYKLIHGRSMVALKNSKTSLIRSRTTKGHGQTHRNIRRMRNLNPLREEDGTQIIKIVRDSNIGNF